MSHPSLGLPPSDETAGLPGAAARIREGRERLGARALEVALDRDPKIKARSDETRLRHLLRDAELLAERVALSVATAEPGLTREYANMTVAVYRRGRIPLDDLIALCEGLRAALPIVLAPDEMGTADAALDEAVQVYRWHRRIAGDARPRNRLLQAIYKGG